MAIARNFRTGLFDRLNSSPDGFTDDDKDKTARQGLLALASGLLGTGGGFGNALGEGIKGGLLAMNQGADGIVNDRYRQAMMQRTMQGMDRNSELEALAKDIVGPDGKIDEAKFTQYAVRDPVSAKALREAVDGPKTRWQMGQVGDGAGGTIDVLFDPVDPSNIRTIDGQPIGPGAAQSQGPTGGAASLLGDAATQVTPDMGLLSQAVMQQESGGDPNAVSSAGARGLMQLMPGTQRDPGFGVQPARDDSPQENMRMGQDYLQAMLSRYGGNQQLALAAYNVGPGRVDQALQAAGGNPEQAIAKLPAETRNYVPSVQKRMSGVPAGAPMIGRRPRKEDKGAEESFSQPQEVVQGGQRMLVQFGNRGTIRPVSGFEPPQNAAAANKEQMALDKQVTSLSKRLSDENVPFVDTSLTTIESMLQPYLDANGRLAAGADIPGYGRAESFMPDLAVSQPARDLRQTVAGLANTILKSRSGAAVTDNELRRFLQEAGTNKGMPEEQLINGLGLIRKWFDKQKTNIKGGYSPQVIENYMRNAPENEGLFGTSTPRGSDIDSLLEKYR